MIPDIPPSLLTSCIIFSVAIIIFPELTKDIYGADLVEDKAVAYIIEGITRKVEKEIQKASSSQALIGLLEMFAP
jgi:hypothetical protein